MEEIPEYSRLLKKISTYCALKERSEKEVSEKLSSWNCPEELASAVIETLKKENFLNEERFARNYVQHKFNTLGWGRLKIAESLVYEGINNEIIRQVLDEIPENEYLNILESLIREGIHKKSLYLSLISKGFEEELVIESLSRMNYTEI